MTGNIGPLLSDNRRENGHPETPLLNSTARWGIVMAMKHMLISLTLTAGLALAATAEAQAACTVEYKAKRDNPLKLFYDVATISGPCTREAARAELQRNLGAQGRTLLKILSVRKK